MPTDTAPPGPGGRRGGLGEWVRRHRGAAAAIGAGGLVAAIYIAKKGPAAASNPNATSTPATPSTYAGSGVGNDAYAGEMAQLQDLLNAYTAGQLGSQLGIQPAPSSTTPKPVTGPPAPKPPVRVFRPITKPKTPATSYVVRRGDTLASIAKRFRLTVPVLAHANKYAEGPKRGQTLGTGAGLPAGQRLVIPGH